MVVVAGDTVVVICVCCIEWSCVVCVCCGGGNGGSGARDIGIRGVIGCCG